MLFGIDAFSNRFGRYWIIAIAYKNYIECVEIQEWVLFTYESTLNIHINVFVLLLRHIVNILYVYFT